MTDKVRPLIESCVTSPREATASLEAGADRLELCTELEVGGLTPPMHLVEQVRDGHECPVHVLVRPRPGDFHFSTTEIAAMCRSIADLAADGVPGIVTGALDRSGAIDPWAMEELLAASEGAAVTFHRAFDELSDIGAGLDALMSLGIERVLTSGGARSAWEGREALRDLVRASDGATTILAGGSIRADHVRDLVAETGVAEVHARAAAIPRLADAFDPRTDPQP